MAGLFYKADNGALLSPCRNYRYSLWRLWRVGPLCNYLGFIGLNPSTADETANDLTITKCKGFAERFGYDGIFMFNLYAYRATNPNALLFAQKNEVDIIGADNIQTITKHAKRCQSLIACWGSQGPKVNKAIELAYYSERLLHALSREVYCLGTTETGAPRHPSRLAYSATLRPFWSPYSE